MFITLIHLGCDVLSRLVVLDEGDGLLNFKAVFQPISRKYDGTNMPLIIAVVLCGGVLQFLVSQQVLGGRKATTNFFTTIQVRHTIIRVLGTCLVVVCFEETHDACDFEAPHSNGEATLSAGIFSLLRGTKMLRAKVRRSISYATIYYIGSGLCSSLALSISKSYIWMAFAEVATAVLLERIHYRWTNAIVERTSHSMVVYSWRELLLPTVGYALARKVVVEVPTAIGTLFVAEGLTSTDAVATRDIAVLASAFTLRFLVLYPAWASLLAFETRCASRPTKISGNQHPSYTHVLRLSYQKVLLRLSSLHLQAAGTMIIIETITSIFGHFLLHTPST
jgi:hypothetical protein